MLRWCKEDLLRLPCQFWRECKHRVLWSSEIHRDHSDIYSARYWTVLLEAESHSILPILVAILQPQALVLHVSSLFKSSAEMVHNVLLMAFPPTPPHPKSVYQATVTPRHFDSVGLMKPNDDQFPIFQKSSSERGDHSIPGSSWGFIALHRTWAFSQISHRCVWCCKGEADESKLAMRENMQTLISWTFLKMLQRI